MVFAFEHLQALALVSSSEYPWLEPLIRFPPQVLWPSRNHDEISRHLSSTLRRGITTHGPAPSFSRFRLLDLVVYHERRSLGTSGESVIDHGTSSRQLGKHIYIYSRVRGEVGTRGTTQKNTGG